jgi:post-segregation antitoxin (ccd killing protein)
MNISVPDDLAEEVRQRNVPISAVCQRALRDEVSRQRGTEPGSQAVSVVAVIDQIRQGLDYIRTTYGGDAQ